jgi:hypothetical protein
MDMDMDMDMDMLMDMEMVFVAGFRERESESRQSRGRTRGNTHQQGCVGSGDTRDRSSRTERKVGKQRGRRSGAEDMHVVTTFARLTLRALPQTTHRTPQVHA